MEWSGKRRLAQTRASARVESLETRELLAAPYGSGLYHPTIAPGLPPNPGFVDRLIAEGKLVTGTDLQGDPWAVRVQGPGQVQVSTTVPNDGENLGDINTIQLVGTDPNLTTVTGQVEPSSQIVTPSSGTITFQRLVDLNGVKSIQLNGFNLVPSFGTPTGVAANDASIYLPGGVQSLSFHDIQAPFDLNSPVMPVTIVIGNPGTPLTVQPSIHIDSIFNTVFNSALASNPNGTPPLAPSVVIIVNGQLKNLDILSATAQPIPSVSQSLFPVVGTTGRTSVNALGIHRLNVAGSARNFTVGRGNFPFERGFSGLRKLDSANFGGNADAVALDVTGGKIGRLTFQRGLGNPAGQTTSISQFGYPSAIAGYPSFGLLGGVVAAQQIGSLNVGEANVSLTIPSDRNRIQYPYLNTTNYIVRPGTALTSAVIASSGSIGATNIYGGSTTSEIKAGFDYPSYVAGLSGTRAASSIGPYYQNGNLVDSVVSATYRAGNHHYGSTKDVVGPGTIRGHFRGILAADGRTTPLGNTGVGFYARRKIGNLPSAAAPFNPVIPQL